MRNWDAGDWFGFFLGLSIAAVSVAFSICMVFDCLVNYCHLKLW